MQKGASKVTYYFYFLIRWQCSVLCLKSLTCPWRFHITGFFIWSLQLWQHFILKLLPHECCAKHIQRLLNFLYYYRSKVWKWYWICLLHLWCLPCQWHCFFLALVSFVIFALLECSHYFMTLSIKKMLESKFVFFYFLVVEIFVKMSPLQHHIVHSQYKHRYIFIW